MKLLLSSIDSLPSIGGVSLLAHHLANGLVEKGASVDFLAPRGSHMPPGFSRQYELIVDESSDASVCEGPDWVAGELKRVSSLVDARLETGAYDRMVALHPTYYGQAMWRVSQRRGVPLSVFIHGFELKSQLMRRKLWSSRKQRAAGFRPTFRREMLNLVRGSDEIITNSAFTSRIVRRAGRRNAIVNAGCGIPLETLRRETERNADSFANRAAFKRHVGLDPDRPVIGMLSRLVAHKNVGSLLRALQDMPEVTAVIAGVGDDEGSLRILAEELGVGHRVVWPGRLSEEEKWDWLRAFDVFCLLSKPGPIGQVEGFGIALLEANAAGTPVIATRSGGMPSFVEHGKTGHLIAVDDRHGLVNGIRTLLTDEPAARACVTEARRQIRERYNWTEIANRLIGHWEISCACGQPPRV